MLECREPSCPAVFTMAVRVPTFIKKHMWGELRSRVHLLVGLLWFVAEMPTFRCGWVCPVGIYLFISSLVHYFVFWPALF